MNEPVSMKASVATVTIRGLGKYSQSRAHEAAKLDGESHDDYDKRTWREHLHVKKVLVGDELVQRVIIPETALMQCLHEGVRYAGEKKKGAATWTKHFMGGIAVNDAAVTDCGPEDAVSEDVYSNADGVRGSGKRVWRRFPILAPWSATFTALVLDPEITKDVFVRMLNTAGKFRGIGRWRPEKGGQNGRFVVEDMLWEDNRELRDVARR